MAPGKDDEGMSDEVLRKLLKPSVSIEQAKDVLTESYAKDGEEVEVLQQLDSYDDCNFKVKIDGKLFLLKIHNGVESKEFNKVFEDADKQFDKQGCMNSVIHLQSTIMQCLSSNFIVTSVPVMTRNTNAPVSVHSLNVVSENHSPRALVVRLMEWVEGRLMNEAAILPVETLADAGRFLGKVDMVLDGMTLGNGLLEPAQRYHQWDGKNLADIRAFTHCITDSKRRDLVLSILDAFQAEIQESGDGAQFRVGVNHGDFNDANILLNGDFLVSGVIDFGDSIQSWRVLDVSVAMAYAMLSTYGKAKRGMSAAAAFLRGYSIEYPLTPLEMKHLVLLVACRLACSVTLGAYSFQKNPENTYLLLHAQPAWGALEMIWGYDHEKRASIRHAFGLLLEQACHFGTATKGPIDCSDIAVPDPTVVDLLAAVRVPARKKSKTDHKGLPMLTFVTGNHKKLEELERIMKADNEDFPFRLTNKKVDLPELQGDPLQIAKEKCTLAAKEVGGPVIIEDTSLCFNSLGRMPGPYIKWFLESCGLEGTNKMLDGFEDKTAYAQTLVAFSAGPGKDPHVFVGETHGKIVMPRGCLDFGWDPIFQPVDQCGQGKTYAEMTRDEKDAISHRSRALAEMRSYFLANRETLLADMS